MKLKDLCKIENGIKEADFWINKTGPISNIGKPTKTFKKEHIGIKVVRTDILVPDYLYYVFEYLHSNGKLSEAACNGKMSREFLNEIKVG